MEASRFDRRYKVQIEDCTVKDHIECIRYYAYHLTRPGAQKNYHMMMIEEHCKGIEKKIGFDC